MVLNNYMRMLCHCASKVCFIWSKLGIPSHLCDLRLSVSSGYGRLGMWSYLVFQGTTS